MVTRDEIINSSGRGPPKYKDGKINPSWSKWARKKVAKYMRKNPPDRKWYDRMYVSQHHTKANAQKASREVPIPTRVVQNKNPNSFKYAVQKVKRR